MRRESSAGAISIRIEGRVRWSRGSVERQTSHRQPIIGTPCEVPVPRNVTLRLNNALSASDASTNRIRSSKSTCSSTWRSSAVRLPRVF